MKNLKNNQAKDGPYLNQVELLQEPTFGQDAYGKLDRNQIFQDHPIPKTQGENRITKKNKSQNAQ